MAGNNTYEKQKELQRQQQQQQQQQLQQQQQMIQQQKAQQQQQAQQSKQQQEDQVAQYRANKQSQATTNTQNELPKSGEVSKSVYASLQALQELQNNKPQAYTSKYQPQLDAVLQQIQDPGKFSYDFNGDELFKLYADEYTQRGRQASMDAMGQAAALTGGYGNSYAQLVGNQAYDEYLTQLYDKGMDLRDKAYEQYLNERQDLYDQYSTIQDTDDTEYNRYRDVVSDWQNDMEFFENQRQYNESLDWEKKQSNLEYAYNIATSILANGQMPSYELLNAAGISEADAYKMMSTSSSSSSGGTSGTDDGITYYVDKYGKYYTYDKEGNARSVDEADIRDIDYIDKTENTGTKGAQAEINDKYRKENDNLKKHYKNGK